MWSGTRSGSVGICQTEPGSLPSGDRARSTLPRLPRSVFLPRFSTRTRVPLKPLLQKMGMRAVWTPDGADLTGIADPAETGEAPLFAGSATHEAWVKVTEKGTEAAAVTVIDVGSGGGSEVPPPTVRLDHPFLWFIRDRVTGAVLFAGLVTDPSVTAE